MAGSKEGGLKARDRNLAKDPNFYKRIGKIGGSKSSNGGFASPYEDDNGLTGPQRASVYGKKGGRTPKHKRTA